MYNLREFRRKPDRLSDLLPWAALVGPGVILNKDGSFQKSYRFRGPDLDSSTREHLITITAQINNVWRRLGTGWVIYAESQRVTSERYPNSQFPEAVTGLIDAERKAFFSSANHFENQYYLTLVYLPPVETAGNLEKYLIDREYEKETANYRIHYKNFVAETEKIFELFQEVMSEAAPLSDPETLTYLHSAVSTKRHRIAVPECPMYLDAYLADTSLTAGMEPILGLRDHARHLRIISVRQFPGSSTPGMLNKLNQLNFEYRWTTRFLCLDKNEALTELTNYQKRWFAKRQGAAAFLKNLLSQGSEGDGYGVTNMDAVLKSEDASQALTELQSDLVSYGYFTMTVAVMDADPNLANKKAQAVEKTLNSLGFVTINETIGAVDAWLGTIPGLFRANIRQPLLSSLNLAHLFPLSAVWAGPETNRHLNAPALMQTQTPELTPYRFNLHVGDVGLTMVVGPPGMGKSVLLALIAAQFCRYAKAQVYFFDKDGSCRALTAGVGGDFYDLAAEAAGTLSFQPLGTIDDENERTWAAEWLYDFLRGENVEITPEVKNVIWKALASLAASPPELRTITNLVNLLQDIPLRLALEPLTLKGAFGRLFDSDHDNLEYGWWQVFEMGKLMTMGAAIPPTLNYLFHRLEQRFTGAPTLLILDESWVFISNPIFADKLREWLKVLRKKNVSVVFATQSLADITKSPVASAIIESCLTKIYLPNPTALDQTTKPLYQDFGLNETEIRIISEAIPKRQYYYKSPLGSRLFELAIGPIALAYCGASRPEEQQMVQRILAEYGPGEFNRQWLKYKNLLEAQDRLNLIENSGGVA